MEGISAVITAIQGEDGYLSHCLTSIKGFVDEIVVVDMSGDGEISKVAKRFKAKIYRHEFVNYVEPVRNFGISKASGNWILVLDPDEETPDSLKRKLREIVENNEADYVRVPRRNIVFGKWLQHSRWWPDFNIRFFKKGKVSWNEIIHGVPTTEGHGVDLEAKEELAITHHHYESVEQFILRMNRYTSIQADLKSKEYKQSLSQQKQSLVRPAGKFTWVDLIVRPTQEFNSRFFAGEGYKDGVHGLALSFLQAFSELVLYLKLWQKEKFKEENIKLSEVVKEISRSQSEINYWQADAMVKSGGGILHKVKRKFKLR